MSMKNNLTNWKLLLLTIVCSVICIVFIKNSTGSRAKKFDGFQKENSNTIVTIPAYEIALSNKSPYTTVLPQKGKRSSTLSRGSIEPIDKNTSKDMETYNYEEDLYTLNESALLESYYTKKANISLTTIMPKETPIVNPHLPDYLMYKNVNITDLKEFLKSKNSLLVEEPYFTTILSVSKDFNLNPLVMFAITGQEQSFVPKNDENAYKIANNPFNVFCSWKKYNTSIKDTASIAARTFVNLSKNKPSNIDAFTWVNQKYSEDKNWSKAIRSIFKQLEVNVSYWK
jgi:hypothetical protein